MSKYSFFQHFNNSDCFHNSKNPTLFLSISTVAVVFCKEDGYGHLSLVLSVPYSNPSFFLTIQAAFHLATEAAMALLPAILLATKVSATALLPATTVAATAPLPAILLATAVAATVLLLATTVVATDLPQIMMMRKTVVPKLLQPPRQSLRAVLRTLGLTN